MQWKKVLVPVGILFIGFAAAMGIASSGPDANVKEQVDTRPIVTVKELSAIDESVTLSSYGDITPLERTALAAQVSGEVVSWNPNFVSGGLLKRGEILFTIEKDAYEAALLQAEAELSSAQAQLIEQQAQADVAKREAAGMSQGSVSDLYLRKPQVLSAKAAVKSAEARLKIAKRDLDNCEVRAPYDALVVDRNIGKGDYLAVGTVAATLNNVETAEMIFPVAGFDSAFLPSPIKGTEATITASFGHQHHAISATIHRDLGTVDQDTRMSYLVARFSDPYGIQSGQPKAKFGAYATIEFAGKTLKDVYRVPQELVNAGKLWLLTDDKKLVGKDVDVIREDGTYFLVRGKLEGQQLVMTPPEYPQDGMAVKVVENKDNGQITAARSNSQ